MAESLSSFPRKQPQHQMMTGNKAVGFFWDIENCPVPRGKPALGVIKRVRKFILNRRDHGEYEFLIACDVTKLRIPIQKDIVSAAGVTLSHVMSSAKNGTDEKLREAMKKFVDTHGESSCLVLISGDIGFVNDLRGYQNRLGVDIIVLHGRNASSHFKEAGWDEVHDFEDFCIPVESIPFKGRGVDLEKHGDQPFRNVDKASQGQGGLSKRQNAGQAQGGPKYHHSGGKSLPFKPPGRSVFAAYGTQEYQQSATTNAKPQFAPSNEIILMVSGLPASMRYSVLRPQLQEYADDVRGRVQFVHNGQGFITFRTLEDALNAMPMLDKIEVCGEKLKVSHVKTIPFPPPKPTDNQQQQQCQITPELHSHGTPRILLDWRGPSLILDVSHGKLWKNSRNPRRTKSLGKRKIPAAPFNKPVTLRIR